MKKINNLDPFRKAKEFINGKQTERTPVGGTIPSPPTVPGEYLKNREGDLVLGSVTQNPPTYPVDSDTNPVLQPLSIDASGNTRVIVVFTGTPTLAVTGNLIVHDTGTVTVTGTVTASLAGTPTVTVTGQINVTATPTGTTTVTAALLHTYSVAAANATVTTLTTNGTFYISPNSGGKIVSVLRVFLNVRTSGATTGIDITLFKATGIPTGGTPSAIGTIIPHNSSDPAATAVAIGFSTNPGVVGPVGPMRVVRLPDGIGTMNPPASIEWLFGIIPGEKPIQLQGTESLLVVFGTIVATQTCDIYLEWAEQ